LHFSLIPSEGEMSDDNAVSIIANQNTRTSRLRWLGLL